MPFDRSRRDAVRAVGLLGFFAPAIITRPAAAQPGGQAGSLDQPEASSGGVEVTPPEDLMREHGVLVRVLLIYEALIPSYRPTRISTRRFSTAPPRSCATSSRTNTRNSRRITSSRASETPGR